MTSACIGPNVKRSDVKVMHEVIKCATDRRGYIAGRLWLLRFLACVYRIDVGDVYMVGLQQLTLNTGAGYHRTAVITRVLHRPTVRVLLYLAHHRCCCCIQLVISLHHIGLYNIAHWFIAVDIKMPDPAGITYSTSPCICCLVFSAGARSDTG